jgi:hypothetical protein
MSDIDYDKLADAIHKGGKTFSLDDKDALQNFLKDLRRSQTTFKSFKDVMSGTQQPIKDMSDALSAYNDEIKELIRAEKEASNEVDRMAASSKRAKLEADRSTAGQAVATKNIGLAAMNFGAGITNIATTLATSTIDFAKGLVKGQTGVQLATDFAAKSAKSTGDSLRGIGQGIEGLGFLVSFLLPEVKLLGVAMKFIGPAIAGLGFLLEKLLPKSADVLSDAIQLAGDEVTRTKDAFTKMTSTGAEFASGMGEMRAYAALAGLDVAQFGNIIKDNQQDLVHMGMGVAEASKRLASISGVLRDPNTGLGAQLNLLGYSFEEQVAISAQVSAQLQASGKLRTTSDAEVARLTVQYGKDLKVLADITGADAKKKADNARLEAMRADIMAKLGPGERERFQAQLRGMPEDLQKGFIQWVVSGGQAVADGATNILRGQYSQIDNIFAEGYKNIKDNSKTTSQVQDEATRQGAILGQQIQDVNRATGAVINVANTMSGGLDGAAGAAADMTNRLIQQTNYTEESLKTSRRNTELAATNQDKLDQNVRNLDESVQRTKAVWTKDLTPSLASFAKSTDVISKYQEKVAEAFKTISEKWGGNQGGGDKGNNNSGGAGTPGSNGAGGGGNGGNDSGSKINYGNLVFKNKEEATAGGGVDAQVIKAAQLISDQYQGTVVNAFNDAYHVKKGKDDPHVQGRAADLNVPGLNKERLAQINQLISSLGVKASVDPSENAAGNHLHIQEMANGGNLGPGQTAIVGERGPEIVQGSGSVTSTAATSRVFNDMLGKLDEMVRVMRDHKDISEDLLHASV